MIMDVRITLARITCWQTEEASREAMVHKVMCERLQEALEMMVACKAHLANTAAPPQVMSGRIGAPELLEAALTG